MVSIPLTQDETKHLSEDQGNARTRCCLQATAPSATGSQVTFDYLNKGAANVIFRIRPEPSSSAKRFQFVDVSPKDKLSGVATPVTHQSLMGTVLRVPRGGQKHLSSEQILHGFEHAIRPLFLPGTRTKIQLDRDLTKHLMDHEGVLLFPDVMDHLYTRVEKLTFANTQSRRKCWGILLPDMSPTPGQSITLEVKPKWLAQSPNAPPKAIRCRTCAMNVSVPKKRDNYICPLQLLHGNSSSLQPWSQTTVMRQFEGGKPPSPVVTSAIAKALLDYVTIGDGITLLQHLLNLQTSLDPRGVLCRPQVDSATFDNNLRLAMTLRDCSLFIKIAYNTAGVTGIESKLGDLDFKSAEKIVDWMDKEKQLLRDGSYTKNMKEGPMCWLQRVQGVSDIVQTWK
ncbi:inositol-pentakisphosphate 2-kinase [Alternaria panax]|uniref:Inositol-pentakisphosphate 2-kinase n=1 Tax=Alternaria panax TaxID=48097 RepID=A0AAD4IFY1_9PLEO|nr:inositol-pentakisphosphate 2-kinase [Alternaria panax]